MNGIALILLMLVVPGWAGAEPLDKTGTSGSPNAPMLAEVPEKQEPAEAGSFLAEREGFSERWPAAITDMQQTVRIVG